MSRPLLVPTLCLALLAPCLAAEEPLLTLVPGDRLRLQLRDGTGPREGRVLGVDALNRRLTVDLGRGPERVDLASVGAAWLGEPRDSARTGVLIGLGVAVVPMLVVGLSEEARGSMPVGGVLLYGGASAALGGLIGLAIKRTEWVPIGAPGPTVAFTTLPAPSGSRGLGVGLKLSW